LTREGSILLAATVAIAGAVAVIAVVALLLLQFAGPSPSWTPVLQDVLKTAYQALAVGALGGMAKLVIDNRRDQQIAAAELRDRRRSMLESVAAASNRVANARLMIKANRSVKTWSESINGSVVEAHTTFRGLAHALTNWSEAGQPVFPDSGHVRQLLDQMCAYLMSLIDEHADNKQRLGEQQRVAEHATDREAALQEVWDHMMALNVLHDFVHEEGSYLEYRRTYLSLLRQMRSALAGATRMPTSDHVTATGPSSAVR
jgi:hypothetical protein